MLGFLKSIANIFTGSLSGIWHWMINLYNTVWSYIYNMYDKLAHDISEGFSYAKNLFDYMTTWVTHVVDNVVNLINKIASDIQHWASDQISKVASYAEDVYHWAIQQVDDLGHAIDKAYDDIESWVISKIWDPLYNFIKPAINWIENEGSQMWDLLTHPEKLVSLLESYLYAAWLTWLQRLAVPITGYILNNMIKLVPTLVSIAEDVISKVLLHASEYPSTSQSVGRKDRP